MCQVSSLMAAAEGPVAEFSSFANLEEKKMKWNFLMSFPKTGNQMGSFGQIRKKSFFRFCRPIYAICGEDVLEKDLVKKGSALKITTLCKNSHSKEWVAQPNVKRVAAGNLLLSGAILFTGNTFSRVSEMVSTVNLAFPSEPDYFNWQKSIYFQLQIRVGSKKKLQSSLISWTENR